MKKICSLAIALILVFTLSVSVFALKTDPNLTVKLKIEGIPEGTAYVDVLLPKEAFGERFVDFNENYRIDSAYRFIAGIDQEPYEEIELYSEDEIAQYHLDGYYSFLSHFDGARTEFGTEQFYSYHDYYYGSDSELDSEAYFYVKSNDGVQTDTLDVFQSAGKIKLAYVRADGGILLVSNAFSVKDRAIIASLFYNAVADGEKVKSEYYISPFNVAFNFIVAAIIVVAAVVIASEVKRKKRKNKEQTQE